jgi:hypothetical protein
MIILESSSFVNKNNCFSGVVFTESSLVKNKGWGDGGEGNGSYVSRHYGSVDGALRFSVSESPIVLRFLGL